MSYRWQQQDFKWKPPSTWKSHQLQSVPLSHSSTNLASYLDDSDINIQTSIPILHAAGLLKVIQSMQSAKLKLNRGSLSDRLTLQARFLYCMWKMIDEEEIETRQLKQIINLLVNSSLTELDRSLKDIYSDTQSIEQFVDTWATLGLQKRRQRQQRGIKTAQKSRKVTNQNSNRSSQKGFQSRSRLKNYDTPLSQVNMLSSSQQICSHFLRQKQKPVVSQYNMQSAEIRRSKENTFKDYAHQQETINRLYQRDHYHHRTVLKKLEEERKSKIQMEKCTFKPSLNNSISGRSRSKSVNGYEKAILRLQVGRKKTVDQRTKLQHKPIGQNYQRNKSMKSKPPSFLQRSVKQAQVQFVIEFDLGRRRVKVRVKEDDVIVDIARSLCKIYTLKQSYFEQICEILSKERKIYEEEKAQKYQQCDY